MCNLHRSFIRSKEQELYIRQLITLDVHCKKNKADQTMQGWHEGDYNYHIFSYKKWACPPNQVQNLYNDLSS